MRESTGVAAGVISLPSGGGGVSPLGDRFQPDLVRGSGSYGVPINLPKGPNELQPSLSLTYSTGSGNGPFGLGWQLGISRIERRTDRGLPSYDDGDQFTIGGAEVLVPVGGNRYRPRDDSRFWSIERTGDSWQIRTGDGRTLHFGRSEASRELAPGGTFAWWLDEELDPAGNAVTYTYRREGNALLADRIGYSIFTVQFVYEPRPDVQRNGRAGFLRTWPHRVQRLELHCDRVAGGPMRTWAMTYGLAANGTSVLERLSLTAEEDGAAAAFPELTFGYTSLDLSAWSIEELRALVPPPRLAGAGTQLADLTGDGLADVIALADGRGLTWRNRGDGTFEGPFAIGGLPSTVSLARGNVALADLEGNGRVDLIAVDQPLELAFSGNGRGGFDPEPVVFARSPTLRLDDSNTRLTDVDGDGATDLVATGREYLLLYEHETGEGWIGPDAVRRIHDLDQFPDVSLSDPAVRLADMSGDGLQDFMVLRSGDVSYWPSLGRGRFGARVEMANAPVFPPDYRADRLRVVDVDGDGCSDIVYFDHDRTLIWRNQSGSGFASPVEIPIAPPPGSRPLAADLRGDGRPAFVWDCPPTVNDSAGYKLLRLDPSRAPYLLTSIRNGTGGEIDIEYSSTTAMRLLDLDAGEPWPSELPFVVHVVGEITERDAVAARTSQLVMRYHDGVWDGPDRFFRGFRRVTVTMSGDESIPGSIQEVAFFQGDPEHGDLVERQRQRALAGTLVATRSFEVTDAGPRLATESTQVWEARPEHDGPGGTVYFPHVVAIEAREISPSGEPAKVDRTRLFDFDVHGNPGRKVREAFADGAPADDTIISEERYTYTTNESDWLVRLPVRSELRDGAGVLWSVQIRHYDGPPFEGLPEGEATRGLPTRVRDLRLLDDRLPADYIASRDLTTLGYEHLGAGADAGWYVTSLAVRRDSNGNVVEQRDPTGVPLTITYDLDALYPVRSVDGRGQETRLTFNPRSGEPSLVELPDGRSVRYECDPIGRLAATFETDDDGAEQLTKAWIVDIDAVPVSITSIAPSAPGAARTDFPAGAAFESLDGASFSRAYYDGFGNQIARVSTGPDAADGSRQFVENERVVLNARGLVRRFRVPRFVPSLDLAPAPPDDPAEVRQRFDFQGNVTETMGPGPAHFRVVRDTFTIHHFEGSGAGLFAESVPPGPPLRIERFDAMGRLRRIEERKDAGSTVSTFYEVSQEGRVLRIVDGDGAEIARYDYGGPGDPIRIRHRDAGTRTYYRNASSSVVERTNADGSTLFNVHDAIGRLVRINYAAAGGPQTVMREIVYDSDPTPSSSGRFLNGRIALVREAGTVLRYSYTRSGKLAAESVRTGATTLETRREYDLQGHPIVIVYPDGHRLAYHLDRTGNVRAINGVVSDIRYAADGALEGYRLANGVAVEMPRDPVSQRLLEVRASKGGSLLRAVQYGYDPVGTIRTMLDRQPGSTEHHTFTYDGLFRVTGYEVRLDGPAGTPLRSGTYGYDDGGNVLAFGDAVPTNLAYGDGTHPGRVTSITTPTGPAAVTYDGRGHMTAFGKLTSLVHDPLDRLIEARLANGTRVEFKYDPQSRRILKRVRKGNSTRTVRYATGLFERHATHRIRHIYLGKLLVASQRIQGASMKPAYFVADHHGTILVATNAAGAAIAQQRYSPFGAALEPAPDLDHYLGRERDAETGLLHLGARQYAPAIGRFTSPDWYVLENPGRPARMPQGYNVYSYALNNPLVFKDPSGLFIPILIGAVIAIAYIAAVATIAALAVGFVAGLVYGLANGQGWGSLLTALETALTTTIGMWLGGITGFIVGGPVGLVIGAIMGGMNGLISGMTGIYDWTSIDGYLAFLSDSTWGLLGTSLGNIVHVVNLFYGDRQYRADLSHRQNRHVYEGGFALKSGFAFTQGNVISNAGQGGKGVNASFIANHEELHITQSRIFGPLFQATYIVWAVGGFIVGSIVWFFNTDEDYGSVIETAAYYDNPFEYWAYKNDSNWPPSGANPVIAWG